MMNDQWVIPTNSSVCVTTLRADDRVSAADILNDNDLSQNLLVVPFPYSPDHFDRFYQEQRAQFTADGFPCSFAIRNEAGLLIGGFAFKEVIRGHRASIGYWLGRPYWGQGIMTSVVASMTEFAIEEWDLVRVSADVFSTNLASGRVLEKAGFQFEGLLRKYHKKGDEFKDARLYAYVSG